MSQQFGWSSELSGWVLSAFWAGYALTQVFGGKVLYAANKFLDCLANIFTASAWHRN